jgi:Flp pilus assembly protein TadG
MSANNLLRRELSRIFRPFRTDAAGAVLVQFALVSPVFIGALGLAAEAAYWREHQLALQSAADSAAQAAAQEGGTQSASIGQAVAAQLGYVNGQGRITVSVTQPATAPGCASSCTVVTIADKVPVLLSAIVGYRGTSTLNGVNMVDISATAVAQQAAGASYCILALAGSGARGITSNGAPNANLQGCNVMSNTGATCNGHDLNANVGNAHGANNGCGVQAGSNKPAVQDPYAGLASNIPSDPCGGSYPQEPAKKKDSELPGSNLWSGSYSFEGVKAVCGDQQLSANAEIDDTTLVIFNGRLDSNGYTLTGKNLTLVFTGSNDSAYQHTPTGGGAFDISAPSEGAWSGMAIYQDPNLTTNVNLSFAGASPTFNLSGVVHLPHASVTFSGAVNKSSSGVTCFGMVVDNITINGTANIFANDSQCSSLNVDLPSSSGLAQLVN